MAIPLKALGQVAPMVMGAGQDAFNSLMSLMAFGANQQRIDQTMGLAEGLLYGPRSGPLANLPFFNQFAPRDPSGGILGKQQALVDKFSPMIEQNYNNTLTNLSNMRNMGLDTFNQQRKDTNAAFDANANAITADATARGLTSSTIMPAMLNNNLRNRQDALGGIEDRALAQRLNFENYALGTGNQALGNYVNSAWMLGNAPLQTETELTRNIMNVLGAVTDAYPNPSFNAQIMNSLGSGMAAPMPKPDTGGLFGSSALGGFSSGAGLAAGMGIGSLFGGGGAGAAMVPSMMFMTPCVDGEAIITTADGPKMLRDVIEGDYVRNVKGEYSRVVYKDFGPAPSVKSGTFVRVTMRGGHSLIITEGHYVGGKPVSEIKPGQPFGFKKHILESKEVVEPRPCGDLLLEGGGGYVANGIAVDSMLELTGLAKVMMEPKEANTNAVRP